MSAEGARKLFVGGISESVTEHELRAVFERGGFNVTHLALPRDRESGRLRGFAFVTLSSEDEANAARSKLQGAACGGRPLSIREFSQEPPKRGPGGPGLERPERPERGPRQELPTVFLGKLPFDATLDDVQRLFSEAGVGQISKLVLPSGPDGRPRGFGFASLESEDQVRLAVSKLNGATLMGRQIVVSPAQAKGSGGAPGGAPPRRDARGPDEGPPRRPGGRFGAPGEEERFEPSFAPELPIFAAHEGKGATRRRDGKKEKRPDKRKGGADSVPRSPKGRRGGGGNWHRWEDEDD